MSESKRTGSPFLSSERCGCCCQRSVPDHADCVSQETAQTLQTTPETHHGVPDKSQCCSWSEVRNKAFALLLSNNGRVELIQKSVNTLFHEGCHFLFLCFFFPGSPLLVFLKDQASSRLIETVIQLSHKSLLRDLYKNHLKGHVVDLALHPIANFPMQRLTAASAKCKLVGSVLQLNRGEKSSSILRNSSKVSLLCPCSS